jgi:hypothetical protein
MTRTVGIILLVVALVVCLLGVAFFGIGGATSQAATASGRILGFALLVVLLVAPMAGVGGFLLVRGRKEQVEEQQAAMQRKILDMVKTRGRVDVSDVVVELQSDLPAVQDMVYKLVGMGVFSGYVNWDEGTLYSTEASELRGIEQCKNCGGNLTLAGKGVIKCPYCGTEYFLAN